MPEFFSYYGAVKRFPSSIVFADACDSLGASSNPSLALEHAFLQSGADAFLGWTNDVHEAFSLNVVEAMFGFLTQSPPSTISQAYSNVSHTDPVPYNGFSANLGLSENSDLTICPMPAVVLSPYGNQTLSTTPGPYDVEVVNSDLTPVAAPGNVTVTVLRQVFSQCGGLLFVSQITDTIPLGQTSIAFASVGNVAGRDPPCMSLPITTTFTVQQATLAPNTVLNLSSVASQPLSLSVTR